MLFCICNCFYIEYCCMYCCCYLLSERMKSAKLLLNGDSKNCGVSFFCYDCNYKINLDEECSIYWFGSSNISSGVSHNILAFCSCSAICYWRLESVLNISLLKILSYLSWTYTLFLHSTFAMSCNLLSAVSQLSNISAIYSNGET